MKSKLSLALLLFIPYSVAMDDDNIFSDDPLSLNTRSTTFDCFDEQQSLLGDQSFNNNTNHNNNPPILQPNAALNSMIMPVVAANQRLEPKICTLCNPFKNFSNYCNYLRHRRTIHINPELRKRFTCSKCLKQFKTKYHLPIHEAKCTKNVVSNNNSNHNDNLPIPACNIPYSATIGFDDPPLDVCPEDVNHFTCPRPVRLLRQAQDKRP